MEIGNVGFDLGVLYRGSLASCNYDCGYCPFAKTESLPGELERDARELERFVRFVGERSDRRLGILFTPWGEALIREHYRNAVVALSRMDHVRRVSVQTNLSCHLDWIERADTSRVGLWCTYHPSEVERETFLAQCRRLDELGVSYSVGVVGLKEHVQEIEALRQTLDPRVYLWVNAYKREHDYYSPHEIARLTAIDPLFPVNNTYHRTLGCNCGAGERAIAVDGDGTVRRCHFIREPIGNLYEGGWEAILLPRPCSNDTCGCHIGYVHLDRLALAGVFGSGILERVPAGRTLRPPKP